MNNDRLTVGTMLLAGLADTHKAEGTINVVLSLFKQALPPALIEEIANQLEGDLANVWRSASTPEEDLFARPRPAKAEDLEVGPLLPVVREVAVALETAKIPYAVGGGLALEAYGVRKSTADIDFFVKREDAEPALALLRQRGYHTQHTSERWIYKAFSGIQVVDFIFSSSLGQPMSDEILERARLRELNGFAFRALSPEDIALFKIPLVLNPLRRDWDDLFALLPKVGEIDWPYLMRQAELPASLFLSFLLVWKERDPSAPIPPEIFEALQARLATERPGHIQQVATAEITTH